MKKKLAIVATVFIACTITINAISNNKETSYQDDNIPIVRKQENLLSYYLENENGEYVESSGTSWPTTGYIFNATLSKCENGSELAWDDTKKSILMTGNMSDKCYIYFDRYVLAVVNSITTSTTYNSITLTATTTKGTSDISKYYYSIDGGNSYSESTSNTFTFNNLSASQKYNISVKVTDSLGKESEVYTTTSTTNDIVLPKVNNVTTSATDSSITLTVSATKGTLDISKYYYSKDGSTFTESSSNTYTFSSLNDSTTYNIVVYVVDTNGNKSSNYTLSSTTKASKPVINSITVVSIDYHGIIKLNIQYTSKNEISSSYINVKNTDTSRESGYFEQQSSSSNEFTYDQWLSTIGFCNGGKFNFTVYIVDSEGNKSETYTTETISVGCFPAGTKIFTKNGYKNIEDIKVNDLVYSFNETTNKVELNKVTKTFIHQDIEIYNLYLENEMIRVTPYHRFYVLRNNNYEWVTAKNLKLTDKLFDSNKKLININKIEYMKENNTVYNFEVANNHTYYVSESNILVHNAKGC